MALTAKQVRGRLDSLGLNSDQRAELGELLSEIWTEVSNLNAWATALATKLNTDFTAQNALNAFPLTLDTNYDTNPQA